MAPISLRLFRCAYSVWRLFQVEPGSKYREDILADRAKETKTIDGIFPVMKKNWQKHFAVDCECEIFFKDETIARYVPGIKYYKMVAIAWEK